MTRKYTTIPYIEYPVADGNYDTSRSAIDLVVLHHTATTYKSAVDWFGNPKAGTSAHYIVSNKGELAAMLEEYNTAYHAGQYAVNQRSIGIETEWYEGMGDRSTALYEKVSALVADICKYHKIPIDSAHIKPHKTYVATQCPGTLDIPRIIDRAKALANPAPVETPLQACLRQHVDLLKQLESANAKCISLQDSISTLNKDLLNSRMDTEKALNDLKSTNTKLADRDNKLIDIQKILNE